jgi:hypothetical protein
VFPKERVEHLVGNASPSTSVYRVPLEMASEFSRGRSLAAKDFAKELIMSDGRAFPAFVVDKDDEQS